MLVFSRICAFSGLALLAGADAAAKPPSVLPTDKNLLYVGRWDKVDPTNYHGNWIGSYVRTTFTGTFVSAVVGGRSGMAVVIDGKPAEAVDGGPGEVMLNKTTLSPGSHTLLVACKGGGSWDFQGLMLDAGASVKAPKERPIIECTGDSITTGSPAPIEAAGNYNWIAAESLGCDHTQISWPGRSLMTGYGYQDDKVGLDVQFFQQNCFYDTPKLSWDFATYTPTLVVINLGQNDGINGDKEAGFRETYIDFVTNIRGVYPRAQIVALRPFSGNHEESIRQAVDFVTRNGDNGVHFVDTRGWLEDADFADGVHPSVAGNEKAAKLLAAQLKPFLTQPVATVRVPADKRVTIGNPAKPETLKQEFQDAYKNGAREITITPGNYRVPDTTGNLFHMQKWQDVTVVMTGCTFTSMSMGDHINLSECNRVSIVGPVIVRHADPCGTQGRVMAMGKSEDGKIFCEWQVDKGYGTDTKGMDNFDVVRKETRKLDRCDLRNFKITPLAGAGKYRIVWPNPNDVPMKVGDWLIHRYSAGGCAVRISNSHNCWINGVTSQNGGHATFFESDGSGGNHFWNCSIACGPKPAGGTEEQLVANWADGLHSIGAFPGPDIQNFTDSGILLDDCIAIRGEFCDVVRSDPSAKMVTVKDQGGAWLIRVGEPVRFVGPKFYGQAVVQEIKKENGNKVLVLNEAMNIPADEKEIHACTTLRCGTYYKVLNSKIGGTRSRGIIAKGDAGLIRGNTFTDCGLGVLLGPGGGEAGYYQFATVENNLIANNRWGGMGFEANGRTALKHTRVFNNRFIDNPTWEGDLVIRLVDDLVLSGNEFSPPTHWPEKPKPAIFVEASRNVRIYGNTIKKPDGYAQPLLKIGRETENISEDVTGTGH